MYRRSRTAISGAALVLVTALAGCATGASASSRPRPVLGLHGGPGQSSASAIADAAARVAQSRFGGLYAGEVLTDQGRKVVVYLTRLDKPAESAITAGVQRGVVSFARAPRPLAFLNRLHQQVTARQAALRRAGINLVSWGPDFITGRENITVQDLTPAKRAVLDRAFGAASLTLATTTRNYIACGCPALFKHPGKKLQVSHHP